MDIRHLFIVYMNLLWTSASSHVFKSHRYFLSVNIPHLCPFSCAPFTEKLNNYPFSVFSVLSHSPLMLSPASIFRQVSCQVTGNLVAVSRGKSSVHMLPGPELSGPAHLVMAPSSLTLLFNWFSEHHWFSFYLSTLPHFPDFSTLPCPWCQSLDHFHAWQWSQVPWFLIPSIGC